MFDAVKSTGFFTPFNRYKNAILIFLLLFIALIIRRYDTIVNPQLWAEDGNIFLMQFEELGMKSLITPYAGYLVLIPRLIVSVFGLLAVNYLYIPLCYSLVTLFITYLICLYCYNCASQLGIRNKLLYATIFMFLPIGADLFMNITNLLWITSLYLVNFLLVGYKRENMYSNSVFILLVGLTGPFSLILSPLAVFVLLVERKKMSLKGILPFIFLLLTAAIQLICLKNTGTLDRATSEPETYHLLKLVTNNMSDLLLLNSPLFASLFPHTKFIISCCAGGLVVLFVLLKIRKILSFKSLVLIGAATLFMGSFIVAFWPIESKLTAFGCSRYYYVPYTCIAWMAIIYFDKKLNFLHLGLYTIFFLFHDKYQRHELPDKIWKAQILEFHEGKREEIEINPGWKIKLKRKQ
jgi:hypothetical protein